MDKKRLESIRKFAGDTIPSMLRRSDTHDYSSRCFYLITLTTEGRRPLLGWLTGRADAPDGSKEAPRICPTALGAAVIREWSGISSRFPQVAVICQQLMPDHFHGILYFREHTDFHLGRIVNGFKVGCNRAYRQLGLTAAQPQSTGKEPTTPSNNSANSSANSGSGASNNSSASNSGAAVPSPWAAAVPQQSSSKGLLWSHGYNDRILHSYYTLERWKNYLHDNPRRLAIRREHPDLFRVCFGVEVAGQQYAAIGNQFLLKTPQKQQVQCSRSLTDKDIQAAVETYLQEARSGSVLVSPAISKGEQMVMRAALDARLPLIFLTPWGFNTFSRPGHQYYEACCEGRFLILAPWPHENRRMPLTRNMCLALNTMAENICNY